MLWADGASPFGRFMELSDRLYERMGRNHGIALGDLAEFLFTHLTEQLKSEPGTVAEPLWADYQHAGRSGRPAFLRPFIGDRPIPRRREVEVRLPARQARHLEQRLP
jgi:hypothetical protein